MDNCRAHSPLRTGHIHKNRALFQGSIKDSDLSILHIKREHGFPEEIAEKALEALQYISAGDGLTRVFNKKDITDYLEEEVKSSRRYNSKVSIILHDINFIKRVNDNY